MNNKKISQFATVSYKDSLLLPAVDMDMPSGAQNVNIFAASIHTGTGLVGPTGPTGPQGVQGPQGLAGIGLNYRGTWVSGSLYAPSDYVFDTGATSPSSMWILQDATNYHSVIRPKDDQLHWAEYTAPPGPTGPASFTDAPNDIQTYGRHATAWTPVLPLSGGTVAGSLNITTSLSVGGSVPISGFGMAIGQVPIFSNRGSRPSYELNGQWIINQASPTGSQGADVFIRHDGTAVTAGTAANINGLLNMTQTVGANDPTANWTMISHATTNSTKGSDTLAAFLATDRAANSNAHIWGAIVSVTCQTGLNSNAVGNATLAMEVDFASSAADDAPNPAKWGGIGNRHLVHYIATRYSGTAQNEVTVGLWFGTTNSYFDSLIGMDIRGDANNGTKVRQVLDTRGAIPPVGVTDPVAAVRMAAGHIIDFNGGPALTSVAGNYFQYFTTTGIKRLRYMVGAIEQWSIDDTGLMSVSKFYVSGLPTAPTGLRAGDFWNDGGIARIGPTANPTVTGSWTFGTTTVPATLIFNLPTSKVGLVKGQLWNNGGIVSVF